MVVQLNVYELLNLLLVISVVAYILFIFVGSTYIYSIVIRIICAIIFVMINTFKIPMEISMGNSYRASILMIIIGLLVVVITSVELGKEL